MRAPLWRGCSPVVSRTAGAAGVGAAGVGADTGAAGVGAINPVPAPVFEEVLEASGLLTLDPILKISKKRNG